MSIGGYLSADFLSAGKASVVTRSIGTFHFDIVTAESHASALKLTENPIESGASVADHAVLEPKSVTINAVMVGYEPPNNTQNVLGIDTGILGRLPLPVSVRAMTDQAINIANRYISSVEQNVEISSRMLAPFLPDFVGFSADTSATLDRIGKAYNELLNIQKSGEPFSVQTGMKFYEDMMLLNIGISQTKDGSAEFTLTLKEMFIVESQTASGLNADQKKAQPKTTQMGKTQPKQVKPSDIGKTAK